MYTKFIILTAQRSGSTYLTNLLGSHPNVVTYSEILNEEQIVWGRDKSGHIIQANTWLLPIRNAATAPFVTLAVFHLYPSIIRAVGFKLTYSQIQFFPKIATYITSKRLYIIHLKRSNLLDMLVSHKRGDASGVWHTENPAGEPIMRFYIHPNECRKYFMDTAALQKKYDEYFLDNPTLTVSYERLRNHKSIELNKIQNFLGLRRSSLSSVFQKLNRSPLDKVIINYSELKREFKNSQWDIFFT